jgi:hypothetical protein
MASTTADEIYYTCQWTDGPVTVKSLAYTELNCYGTYTMTFSDGSILTFVGEVYALGAYCNPVTFFKWNEVFPGYTQEASDSARSRIDAVADDCAQITSFTLCHDTTTGDCDVCDTTLYINTDSGDIPYFGFRSIHNGNYGNDMTISYTDAIGNVVYNKRILL